MHMLCEECGQHPAAVHLTQIVNNQRTELHLCQSCAAKRQEIGQLMPFSIHDLLAGFMDVGKVSSAYEKAPAVRCEGCGLDYNQFKKTGQLGCRRCYVSFQKDLQPVLRKIQGRLEHTGKVPRRCGLAIHLRRQIQELRSDLKKAVETEAFEEAVRIRDRLKELEQQVRGEEGHGDELDQ